MADFEIPLDTDFEQYSFAADLEGSTYTFFIRWSRREEAWYLSVENADGVVVLSGEKIVAAWALGVDQEIIPGTLLTIDADDSGIPPGREELGERVKLFYVESS